MFLRSINSRHTPDKHVKSLAASAAEKPDI